MPVLQAPARPDDVGLRASRPARTPPRRAATATPTPSSAPAATPLLPRVPDHTRRQLPSTPRRTAPSPCNPTTQRPSQARRVQARPDYPDAPALPRARTPAPTEQLPSPDARPSQAPRPATRLSRDRATALSVHSALMIFVSSVSLPRFSLPPLTQLMAD